MLKTLSIQLFLGLDVTALDNAAKQLNHIERFSHN